ncbi:MAG TPA: PAS domain S-box protein, partial [Gemmatimonadales bacterium]|nr:PAS domain S-box protein [Gemmatimonadales bacterium]
MTHGTMQGAKQRRTEAALQESEARFRAIFDGAAFGIAVVGMDGRPQHCNPALERILGYNQTELRGMTFASFTHPDDVAVDVGHFDELCRGIRDEYHIDKRYIRKDGRIVWVRLSVSALHDTSGETTCLIGMAEDLTAEKDGQAERERLLHDLRRSEERLRLALGAAAMGIWEWDVATNRVTWSEQLEQIVGLAPGAFGGTLDAFQELVHPEDLPAFQQAIRAVVDDPKHGDTFEEEFRFLLPDSAHRWVATRARLLRDEGGRPTRLLGMAHDISRLRQLEHQFHQAQKMEAVGRLAGGVAHDFNNLLTAIKGYSEFLMEEMPITDKRRADVEEISAAADRAAALTKQLLAFSRSQVLDPKIIDPNAVVTSMEKLVRRLIGSDIEVHVILAKAPGAVRVDPGQLEQVIMNLAVNARDAMADGGTLTIETSVVDLGERLIEQRMNLAPGRYVVLTVSDTGTGMTAEVQARLFEPFFTTKEKGRGTGLGLSTVYGIVQQSGGAIWVYGQP